MPLSFFPYKIFNKIRPRIMLRRAPTALVISQRGLKKIAATMISSSSASVTSWRRGALPTLCRRARRASIIY